MSTDQVTSSDNKVVSLSDWRERGTATEPSADTVHLGREQSGMLVEHLPDASPSGPGVLRLTGLGAATLARTAFDYLRAAEYGAMIREAKAAAKSLPRGSQERAEALAAVAALREERQGVVADRARDKRVIATGVGAASVPLVASAFLGPLALGLLLPAPAVLYFVGKHEQKEREKDAARIVPGKVVEPQPVAAEESGDITDERITAALRGIKVIGDQQTITPVGLPRTVEGDAVEIAFRLPVNVDAAELVKKQGKFAGALGRPAECIDITEGETSRDVILWVAGAVPFSAPSGPSPLVTADHWSIWDGVPFGRNRKSWRKTIQVLWSSLLFGGAQGFGKTSAMYIPAAAGVLDPHVRLLLADFKGGADWEELEQIAHRVIIGADPAAIDRFIALVDELIREMDERFARLRAMPKSRRPEMKLTPEIARDDDMPVLMFVIDEIQEAFGAVLARQDGPKQFKALVEKLARLIRRGRACGLIIIAAAQRPSATSTPTDFRDVILTRYSVHVIDDTSSDMILGDKMASKGITAAGLGRIGIGMLVEPDGGEKIQPDRITPQQFEQICARGRALRIAAGTLTGHAAAGMATATGVLAWMREAFERSGVDELGSTDLARIFHSRAPGDGWGQADDESDKAWASRVGARLGREIDAALEGTGKTLPKVKVTTLAGGEGRGYTSDDFDRLFDA